MRVFNAHLGVRVTPLCKPDLSIPDVMETFTLPPTDDAAELMRNLGSTMSLAHALLQTRVSAAEADLIAEAMQRQGRALLRWHEGATDRPVQFHYDDEDDHSHVNVRIWIDVTHSANRAHQIPREKLNAQ